MATEISLTEARTTPGFQNMSDADIIKFAESNDFKVTGADNKDEPPLTMAQARATPGYENVSDQGIIDNAKKAGLDTSELLPKYTFGQKAADTGRLLTQSALGMAGNIGYLMDKTGIEPFKGAGAALDKSGADESARLNAHLSPQMQEAQQTPLVNPDYKPGTPGGSSYLNPKFGLTELAANTVPSALSTLVMGELSMPLMAASEAGLGALGVGQKLAQLVAKAGVTKEALTEGAAGINRLIGSGIGAGAVEGPMSAVQDADQWAAEQKAKPIEDFIFSPDFQAEYKANGGDVAAAKEAVIKKGENKILKDVSWQTGLTDVLTAGGLPGILRNAHGPLANAVKGGFIVNALKGAGSEGLQETIQSGAEQHTMNQAQQYINPKQNEWEGVPNAALTGGAAGFAMGLVGGGGGDVNANPNPVQAGRGTNTPAQDKKEAEDQAAIRAATEAQIKAEEATQQQPTPQPAQQPDNQWQNPDGSSKIVSNEQGDTVVSQEPAATYAPSDEYGNTKDKVEPDLAQQKARIQKANEEIKKLNVEGEDARSVTIGDKAYPATNFIRAQIRHGGISYDEAKANFDKLHEEQNPTQQPEIDNGGITPTHDALPETPTESTGQEPVSGQADSTPISPINQNNGSINENNTSPTPEENVQAPAGENAVDTTVSNEGVGNQSPEVAQPEAQTASAEPLTQPENDNGRTSEATPQQETQNADASQEKGLLGGVNEPTSPNKPLPTETDNAISFPKTAEQQQNSNTQQNPKSDNAALQGQHNAKENVILNEKAKAPEQSGVTLLENDTENDTENGPHPHVNLNTLTDLGNKYQSIANEAYSRAANKIAAELGITKPKGNKLPLHSFATDSEHKAIDAEAVKDPAYLAAKDKAAKQSAYATKVFADIKAWEDAKGGQQKPTTDTTTGNQKNEEQNGQLSKTSTVQPILSNSGTGSEGAPTAEGLNASGQATEGAKSSEQKAEIDAAAHEAATSPLTPLQESAPSAVTSTHEQTDHERYKQALKGINEANAKLAQKQPGTVTHESRVAATVSLLAKKLKLDKDALVKAFLAAKGHDVGKTGMHNIVNKPEGLSDAEFATVKKHPELTEKILRKHGIPEDVIKTAKEHHMQAKEGKGYPIHEGTSDFASQILQIADIADSLIGGADSGHTKPNITWTENGEKKTGARTRSNIIAAMNSMRDSGEINADIYSVYKQMLASNNIPAAQRAQLELTQKTEDAKNNPEPPKPTKKSKPQNETKKEEPKSSQTSQPITNAITDPKEAKNHLVKQFGPGVNALINSGTLTLTEGKETWPEAAKKGDYEAAEAVYVNGKAYIDLQATDRSRLSAVLLHELGEHFNLRRMITSNIYDAVQRQIINLNNNNDRVVSKAWAGVSKDYPGLTPGSEPFISEVIARAGETDKNTTWYKRIISQVKAFLMKRGLARGFLTGTLTGADMHALLVASLRSALVGRVLNVPHFYNAVTEELSYAVKRKMPDSTKQEAVKLYESGMSSHAVAELLDVNFSSVLNWVKQAGKQTRAVYDHHGITDEIRIRAVELYKEGEATKDISSLVGASTSSILDWVRRSGVPVRGNAELRGITKEIKREALELYEGGTSAQKVADKLDISISSVLDWAKADGIMVRTQSESMGVQKGTMEEAIASYEKGSSTKEVAKSLGVSETSVRKWLNGAGVHIRTNAENLGITKEMRKEAASLYQEGLSPDAISKRIGVSGITVVNWVRAAGIPIRSYSEAQSLREQKGNYVHPNGSRAIVTTKNYGELRADSTYEAARILQLDKNPEVVYLSRYVGAIPYGVGRNYHPDFYVRYANGERVVEEVKPNYRSNDPDVLEKADAARNILGDDVSYKIITEKDIDFSHPFKDNIFKFSNDAEREKFKKALTAARREQLRDRSPRFSFAGPKALTADLYSKELAEQRVANGESEEQVRQDTGWFKGEDKQWKFEISDRDASMKASGDFMEIYETQMRKLKSRGEELTVGDIVNHPKLFAAYPKLANIEVKIMPYDAHGKGRVAMNKDGTLSHIEINDNLDGKETLSTLLHEMQHVTQDVEGFARGGSAKQLSEKYFSENYQHQLADLKKEAEAAMQSGNREKTDAVYKKIVDLYSPASFDAYKRLAGEVEARNVQIRQALTEAQRKMLSPESTQDTIGKDQIVVWNGKQMESRTEATKEASEKRIKDLFAGAKPEPVHGVKILDKSDIFDMLGLSKRNVLIAEAHGLVQGRISHSAFTETDWNKVPEWIDNPIAVFKQEDKAYRFIGPELLNGHPVVMAVKPNEKSQLGAGIQIDILKTAFAKDDPKKRMPMQQWVDHGDLVYANLSKTAQFKADTGYSLPVRLNDLKVIKQKVAFKNKELAKQKRTLLENPDVKTESNLATYKAEEEKKNPVAGDTADTIHSASSTEQQDSNKGKSLAAVEAVDTIHSTSATEQQSSKSDTIQQKGSDVKFSKPSVSEEDAYQAEKAKIADYVDANFTKIVNKMKAEKFISVKC